MDYLLISNKQNPLVLATFLNRARRRPPNPLTDRRDSIPPATITRRLQHNRKIVISMAPKHLIPKSLHESLQTLNPQNTILYINIYKQTTNQPKTMPEIDLNFSTFNFTHFSVHRNLPLTAVIRFTKLRSSFRTREIHKCIPQI